MPAPTSARIDAIQVQSFTPLSSPKKRKLAELNELESAPAKMQNPSDESTGHDSLLTSILNAMLPEVPQVPAVLDRAILKEPGGGHGAHDKTWHLFWDENAWKHKKPFMQRFISSRGNEYFCEIDEDYLTDRFNLTGLNTEVQYYQYALDLVTDVFDLDCDDEMRETIEKSARHLYGLVHARYIVTTRGLSKMLEKYKKSDFGKCPRVMCKSHALLPMGQADNPNVKAVKLYCSKCEDIYNPKSSRHASIDGAYFGTSFHNIIFQVYPALIPPKSYDRYVPRIYGFKVHAPATLIRWQHAEREDMRKRLRKLEIESGFKDDEEDIEAEDSEEEEEEEADMDAVGNGAVAGGELRNQI